MSKSSAWDSLPREPEDRQNLKKAIEKYIKKLQLQQQQNNQQKINKLNLRIELIDKCSQLSLTRVNNLQEIFKHYCTHIYKTGKHMTFDRLQYQKVHLTMDRFFLFLRDFGLTVMEIDGKQKQVIDKNVIVTNFKKISSNSKDLTFQQFITSIEKIAIIYYHSKQNYHIKQQRIKQSRKKRRQEYQRKRKIKLKKQQKQQIKKQQQQDEEKQQQQQQQQQKKQQNDDLIKQMMDNNNLQNPNQQINKILKLNQQKQDITIKWQQQGKKSNIYDKLANDQQLQILTKNQKIQYYYKLINVDNVNDYRNKMSQLNLPIYNHYSKSAKGKKRQQSENLKNSQDGPSIQGSMNNLQNQERLQALKEKLHEKKNKQKNTPIPKPKNQPPISSKAEEERKKRREINKERMEKAKKSKEQSDALLQKKMDLKRFPAFDRKPQYNEKQVSWNVMKIPIQQLKLKQFQPQKLYLAEDDDRIFLQEFGADPVRNRAGSGLQIRQRNSVSIIDGIKKRITEVQKTQRKQQTNLNNLSKKLGQNQLVRNKF